MKLQAQMKFMNQYMDLCYIDKTLILYNLKNMSNAFHILKFSPFRPHF